MEQVAPAADQPHEVLHRQGEPGQCVVLGHGDVDDLVRLQRVAVDRPLPELLALEVDLLEFALLGEEHVGTGRLGGVFDAAALVAAAVGVARVVEHLHLFGAGRKCHGDQRGHHRRVGIGRLLGLSVPADVGFDHHHVALGHESFHAAEGVHRGAGDRPGIFAPDHRQHRCPAGWLREQLQGIDELRADRARRDRLDECPSIHGIPALLTISEWWVRFTA